MKASHSSALGSQALDRALDLLEGIANHDGELALNAIAASIGIPMSSAYRLVSRFEARGLIVRVSRGRYRIGLGMNALVQRLDPKALLAQIARPPIRKLARATGRTGHLGVLEADMVTYLIKEGAKGDLLTREMMQLEAYCSAIGKVLLAHQDDDARDRYLASGPFVALTDRTVTDPFRLRDHLAEVRRRGFAIDDGEVADGLFCVAVPIRLRDGTVMAALSSSAAGGSSSVRVTDLLEALHCCAAEIERKANGSG
jgi:IclR family acetate operon transcriptional repressor